jgi:RecQ family ATP-dependent DNA helicase
MDENRDKYNQILKKYFGYDKLKDLQFEIINNVIEGEDVCALLPTGFGKSICYQLPFLITGKCVIVISPLIALMEDQVNQLNKLNIPVMCLSSTNKNKSEEIDEVFSGVHKIIYTTPEYICLNSEFIERLVHEDILELVAIDESHCVSNWGHNFRQDYQKLGCIRNIIGNISILALTATATNNIVNDICRTLQLDNPKLIKGNFDRPNLYISIEQRYDGNKNTLNSFNDSIIPLLHKFKDQKILIYCKKKSDTDEVAEKITNKGIICKSYHAGKSSKERTQIQNDYTSDKINCITATIAFGLGINIPNIRLLIHYNCPGDLESYYQEIGRAGRDGKPSYCYMFYGTQDFFINNMFIQEYKEPFRTYKEKEAHKMKCFVKTQTCRRKILLVHFGDEYSTNCNNCDNCKTCILPTRDFTQEFLLLMNLVFSFSAGFGANKYIQILRNSSKKIVEQFNSKYTGKGRNYSEEWWKNFIRLLLLKEYFTEEKISGNYFGSILKPTSHTIKWYSTNKNNVNDPIILEINSSFQKLDTIYKSNLNNEKNQITDIFNPLVFEINDKLLNEKIKKVYNLFF